MKLTWYYEQSSVNWIQLSELYRIAPLGEKPAEDLKTVFSSSRYKCFIYADTMLIGVGRGLADGLDCSYICDIAVHPEHQGIGLGKAIVEKLVAMSEGHKKIILYANPGKEGFYGKLGFKKMNTAMAIFNDQKHAIDTGLVG
ncbi:MAG: GNAT family N-acetyltransferase [Proteobacteria bacterium]|nr:GNAT family N-acetyltransferase [Pseudomonadota bacterium]